jgi:hypothetical protein
MFLSMRSRLLLAASLLLALTPSASAADSALTTYDFWCSPGSPSATAWYDDKVCVMLEAETPGDRDPATMDAIVQFFSDLYGEFEQLTGLTSLPKSGPWNGRIVIQVPLDNCGAGGLANHGTLGISVGVGLFESQYAKVAQNKFLQVFFYEINRNFWLPSFNDKFDWAMDGNPVNWGWWTVGMNNAQAYTMADILGVELEYFGSGSSSWYTRMVGELDDYIADPQYDFDFGWRQSLMPWHPTESINDMMSGLIMVSFETWGGRAFLEGFYQWIQSPQIPDRSGVFAYQECRDNVYRVWSMAAGQDLASYFTGTLRWTLSGDAQDWVVATLGGAGWTDLGGGLAGLLGEPVLTGTGAMTPGSTVTLDLANALPFGTTNLVAGFTQLSASFKGGVLIPSADVLLLGLPLVSSTHSFSYTFPAGVPTGTEVFYQHWVQDGTGPKGFTASNGVKGTSP